MSNRGMSILWAPGKTDPRPTRALTRLDDITVELSAIRNDFNAARDSFLKRYDQSVQDWIARHPQWHALIANSTVSADYVRSRISFRWQMFRVAQPAVAPGQSRDDLADDISQLGNTLFGEIAKAAGEAWQRCYAGKTEITRKALSPLKTMYDKLMRLTFVEPRVQPVAELLDVAFRSIPKRGPITGSLLVMLQGLVALLQNPKALMEHGQMILDGRKNSHGILESLLMAECAVQLETERAATEETASSLAADTAPPLIRSHGLW